LEGIPNLEKKNKDFDQWLLCVIPETKRDDYRTKHFIPDTALTIDNFLVFVEQRKKLLLKRLKEELHWTAIER
jgi:hypothetical protein